MAVALAIDGFDGTLARHFRVADILPRWSGDALDLVVDFTTYVFVPAYALVASGLLPDAVALALGVAIVISAAIYCADRDMKTARQFVSRLSGALERDRVPSVCLEAAAVGGGGDRCDLCDPDLRAVPDLHPLRVPHMRIVNALALLAWAALAFYALLSNLQPGPGSSRR